MIIGPSWSFTAIDFETANRYRNSACAVGLVQVRGGRVARRLTRLIRPPFACFQFTHIHGITRGEVAAEPSFAELWPELAPYFEGVDFIAAHNRGFDRGVLRACCGWYGLPMPDAPFECTVALARRVWGIYPTKLSDVARALRIPLHHHDAGSDAAACAQIVLRSLAA
jgi:DNA polymerase-3 subunit epsilon